MWCSRSAADVATGAQALKEQPEAELQAGARDCGGGGRPCQGSHRGEVPRAGTLRSKPSGPQRRSLAGAGFIIQAYEVSVIAVTLPHMLCPCSPPK